mmetsp:Transcript_11283/g.16676  ORF Transcript_11283/g.16676 Transcript_11283/m.16676 type:complete len:202 (-) Transcript_11283:349-954(-)
MCLIINKNIKIPYKPWMMKVIEKKKRHEKKKMKRQLASTSKKKDSKKALFQRQSTFSFDTKNRKHADLLNELKKSKADLKSMKKEYKKLRLKLENQKGFKLASSSYPITSFELSSLRVDDDTPVTPISPSSNDSLSPSSSLHHQKQISLDDTPAHMAMVMMDYPSSSPKASTPRSTRLPKLKTKVKRSKTMIGSTPEEYHL